MTEGLHTLVTENVWDSAPFSLVEVDHADDAGSTHLQNVGVLQRDYTAPYYIPKAVVFTFATARTLHLT